MIKILLIFFKVATVKLTYFKYVREVSYMKYPI